MKAPFDIAADLDTPVSAFRKLAPLKPHFLLESVEGGERLGRYSFIGFGEGLHFCLDGETLEIGNEKRPAPPDRAGRRAPRRHGRGRERPRCAGAHRHHHHRHQVWSCVVRGEGRRAQSSVETIVRGPAEVRVSK